MDESWRIPIGSVVPRRRSTEQTRRLDVGGLGPDDFRDVFGGPPRSVALLRQFSGGDIASPSSSSFSSSSTASYFDRLHRDHHTGASRRRPSFYEEVFRRQRTESHQGTKIGRSLPDFTIPSAKLGARRAEGEEFNGVFGRESDRRSRTRSRQSKSNSSSVLSSEDHDGGEPMRPHHRPWPADHDGALTSFSSKLRSITIPCRRGDARSPASPDEQISRTTTVPCLLPSLVELGFEEFVAAGTRADDSCKLFRPYKSETIVSVEYWKMPAASDEDDGDCGSPSSVISSIYDVPMATIRPLSRENREKGAPEAAMDIVMALEEEEEGADGSYVIGFIPAAALEAAESEGSSAAAAAALDEAIAWAKEKFRGAPLPEGIGAGEDQKKRKEDTHTHACGVRR